MQTDGKASTTGNAAPLNKAQKLKSTSLPRTSIGASSRTWRLLCCRFFCLWLLNYCGCEQTYWMKEKRSFFLVTFYQPFLPLCFWCKSCESKGNDQSGPKVLFLFLAALLIDVKAALLFQTYIYSSLLILQVEMGKSWCAATEKKTQEVALMSWSEDVCFKSLLAIYYILFNADMSYYSDYIYISRDKAGMIHGFEPLAKAQSVLHR